MSTPYEKRRLLVLGGGPMQVEALQVARRLGLATVCVDPSTDAPCRVLADAFHVADLRDLPALEKIAARHDIDGVLTLAADYPLPAVSHLCASFDLEGPSSEAVARVCDKAKLREATSRELGNAPRWREFTSVSAASECELLRAGASIVKPVDSSGGRGVTQLTPASAPMEVAAAVETALGASKAGRVVIEEFVAGPEFSAESITYRGKTRTVAITEKFTSGAPYFLEVGHVVPAELPAETTRAIERFIERVVALTGIDNCASHVEFKLTPRGIVLIEAAGRLGGGFINTDLVPLALGVDMVRAAIDVALGEQPSLEPTRREAAAIRFLIPPSGTFGGVDGLADVARMPGVHRVVCEYALGEKIPVVRDATGRKGHLICHAENPSEVKAMAQRYTETIVFQVKENG